MHPTSHLLEPHETLHQIGSHEVSFSVGSNTSIELTLLWTNITTPPPLESSGLDLEKRMKPSMSNSVKDLNQVSDMHKTCGYSLDHVVTHRIPTRSVLHAIYVCYL